MMKEISEIKTLTALLDSGALDADEYKARVLCILAKTLTKPNKRLAHFFKLYERGKENGSVFL